MSKVSEGAADSGSPGRKRKSLDGGHKPPKKASGSKDKSGSRDASRTDSSTSKVEVPRKKERHRDRKNKGKPKAL